MIIGAVVSFTVNEVAHVEALVKPSVAVMVTTCEPMPTSVPATGDWLSVTPVQLSLATTLGRKFGTAETHDVFAEPTSGGAHVVMTGGVVSTTVKLVPHVVELVDASVTVIVTECVPRENSVPAAGDCVIVTLLQLSLALVVAVKSGVAPMQLESAETIWVGAHALMTGGVVSLTVNDVRHVAVSSDGSVAVRVTFVVPRPTGVPAGGVCVMLVTEQLSLAVASATKSGTGAVHVAPAEADCGSGQFVNTGGVVSVTVTWKVHEVGLPHASVVLHVTG